MANQSSSQRSPRTRSTLVDVAREAGVSPATVDRVLNNRPGVHTRTRALVIDTAQRLGYIADAAGVSLPAAALNVRLDFVLPMGTNPFIRMLHAQLEQQGAARPDLDLRISTIEGFDPDVLARALRDLAGTSLGVGVIALDHPTVREAIRALSGSGVKVLTLASDISHVPRVAYVGIDNRAAGRVAGYILGRFLGNSAGRKVALFAGSLSYRGHEEREMGFRHIVAEEFADMQVLELREVMDDFDRAYVEASNLLKRHPDIAGVYNIGGGTEGIARALRDTNRATEVVFIGHELTEANKALLLEGTLDAVIDQNPRVEARESLNILINSVKGTPYDYHAPRLQIICKENLPEV